MPLANLTPGTSARTGVVRYRAVRCSSHPVDYERAVLVIQETQQIAEVPLAVAQILSLCQGCRSIDEHADAVAQMGRVRDPAIIRPALSVLVAAGLLQDQADLLACAKSTDPVTSPEITTIGVVTADRSEQLRRCIDLITKQCDLFGRRPRILVVDGSRTSFHAMANRAAVAETCQKRFNALYVGADEAASLRSAYLDRGFEGDALQFALTPGHIGSNRNLLLLLTQGEHVLMVDDDVRFEPWTLKERELTLSFKGHGDAREMSFFPSRMEAFSAAERINVDLVGAHGALLGRSLASLVTGSGADPDLRHACGHMLSNLSERGVNARVRITMAGLAGDSGFHCAYRLLFSQGGLHSQSGSSQGLDTALSSREVWCIARQPIITHDHACMAYCMGLANYLGVPPFLPVGRNEDGVFGAMLALCQPATLFCHLPYGILHDSNRPSQLEPDVIPSASYTRISDVVLLLLRRAAAATISACPDSRIAQFAMTLIEAGSLEPSEFSMWVARSVLDLRAQEMSKLEAAMSKGDSEYPRSWHLALDRYRDSFVRRASKPNFFVPIEFQGGRPIEEAQAFLCNFAQLLSVWRNLVTAQSDLGWSSAG